MKITVNIERKYSVEIDVSENNLLEIVDDYNGNIRDWAKDNYDEWIVENDKIYESFESVEYEDVEFEHRKAFTVENRDKILQYQLENRKRLELQKKQIDVPSTILDWEEVELDKKALEKASFFVDFNNPRFELNYIHINNNIVEATDTRRAIQIESQKDIRAEILFSIFFIDLLKDGAKVYLSPNIKGSAKREVIVNLKDKWYLIEDNFNYPDIARIIDTKECEKISPILDIRAIKYRCIKAYMDVELQRADEKKRQEETESIVNDTEAVYQEFLKIREVIKNTNSTFEHIERAAMFNPLYMHYYNQINDIINQHFKAGDYFIPGFLTLETLRLYEEKGYKDFEQFNLEALQNEFEIFDPKNKSHKKDISKHYKCAFDLVNKLSDFKVMKKIKAKRKKAKL